ncbi:MAG: hypothetical protein PHO30_03400 [Candidatus Omnitrophica bacterium]|nr:hypothetical protein [Candidatus Omnitrophota bacterium]
MKKTSTIVVLFFFILSITVPGWAQDKIKLKYDFQVGTKLNYRMSVDGDVLIEIAGNQGAAMSKNAARMQGLFNYTHEVAARNDDEKTVTLNIAYGKSYMNTIVSNNVVPNPDVPQLEGKVAVVTVSENGDIKDYRLPQGLPPALQNADFKKMFTDFPARELRVGESWFSNVKTVDDNNADFTVTNSADTTYTVMGIEKKGAYECVKVEIAATTVSSTTSKKPELIINGAVEGRVEGVIFFELKHGFVVYSQLRTRISNKVVNGENIIDLRTGEKKQSPLITTTVDTDMNTVTELL